MMNFLTNYTLEGTYNPNTLLLQYAYSSIVLGTTAQNNLTTVQ